MKDIDTLLSELTLEEKASLLSGHKSWHTVAIPRLDIPSVYITDGPHGLRKKREDSTDIGLGTTELSTAFPPAVTTASSWNAPLIREMGEAIGRECNHYDVSVLLGPAINIKRNPHCGRNFEYFSEDPLITGVMGGAITGGIESTGVSTSVKHFACNNDEGNRYFGDAVVDERAMREIYLRGFERIVKSANPATIMCAYNKVNSEYASENKHLLTEILREEWGFSGLVMSDWGAVNERVRGLMAGLDLEMPGDVNYNRQLIIDAVNSGELEGEVLDTAVRRVLNMVEKGIKRGENAPISDESIFEANAELARRVAEDSAVLLKNEDGALPLKPDGEYVVVGELFERMRYQGAGSSLLNPYKLVSPKDAFSAHGVSFVYERGYDKDDDAPNEAYEEAAIKAAEGKTVLFFGGLTDSAESEGKDRAHLMIPENQRNLIEKLTRVASSVIFVMYGGSPCELPFADDLSAILNMHLPGEMGGEATYSLLFGKTSPSGRLSESWIYSAADIPFGDEFVKTKADVYKESIFVGYRYYTTYGVPVRYPFGFGLSYSKFSYSDMRIDSAKDGYLVSVNLKNEGDIEASEVVELYAEAPKTELIKPVRELVAFTKVKLAPGEEVRVELPLKTDDLCHYVGDAWQLEGGEYTLVIARDVETPILTAKLQLCGATLSSPEKIRECYSTRERMLAISDDDFIEMSGRTINREPTSRPYDMNSPIREFTSLGGKFLLGLISLGSKLAYFFTSLEKDSPEKVTKLKNLEFGYANMLTLSLRALCFASEGVLSYRRAEGLLALANNHPLRALWMLITPERATKLPKQEK